mgnify:FL=1
MKKKNKFAEHYFKNLIISSSLIDYKKLEKFANELAKVKKKNGRLFFIGVGGSAGNCSHAVNDFRKLCNFESYSPVDNVSELTARINDEGWDSSYSDWLIASKVKKNDALFVMSVGGGNKRANVSTNLIKSIDLAIRKKIKIFGVVGKDDGYLYKKGDYVLKVPVNDKKLLTPLSESFQAVIWHYLVSHPLLKEKPTKW